MMPYMRQLLCSYTMFISSAKSTYPIAKNLVTSPVRAMSAERESLVDLTVDSEGIATVTMQRPPVNCLNLELLQDISNSLDEVARNKCKGMILTSASPKVFSAGLDLLELYKPDLKRFEKHWTTLQEVWLKLFGSDFITAAAINGHAPAGGCVLAISCEYRSMVSGTIGLNESALGLVVPFWILDNFHHVLSAREAEFALTSSKLYTVDNALKVGLIDSAATDKAEAIEKCKQYIKKFDNIPSFARVMTKQKIREPILQKLRERRKEDMDTFIGQVIDPKTQFTIGLHLESLKKGAKSK